MTIKEKIKKIIEDESIVKDIYENGGCFKNIIIPVIENSNDDELLYDLITITALQCQLYDTVLDNIAQLGSEELIKKCRADLSSMISDSEK